MKDTVLDNCRTVLYLHGFASSPNSQKIQSLRGLLAPSATTSEQGRRCHHPGHGIVGGAGGEQVSVRLAAHQGEAIAGQ